MSESSTNPDSPNGGHMHDRRRPRPSGRSILRRIVRWALIVALLLVAWSLIEARTLGVSRVVYSSPDVPAEFNGCRIVFVTDVHAGRLFSRKRVTALVNRINAQKPDIVVLGGDNVGGYSGGLDTFYPEAARIRSSLGIVAVLGNHDAWEGARRSRAGLRHVGATLLDNRGVRVVSGGASIRVAGVEDLDTGRPNVAAAASDIARNEFAILVSHNPDVFAEQLAPCAKAFDLAVAGHTQGGQVTLFGLWAPYVPSRYGNRFRSGWFRESGVDVLVSRGVGTMSLPLRFFAPPEINVIVLEHGPHAVSPAR